MAVKISRADVTADRILSVPNPFIRVPIDQYMQTIGVEPLPSQIAIINAVNKYRFVTAAISRRQGKTYIANIIGQCITLFPGSNVLIMSPNYQLSSISWDLQHQLMKIHGLDKEVVKDNAKDRVVEMPNGSTIRMGSINQVDSAVGRSYDLIIFDEAALTDGSQAFQQALRPTLDKPNSRAIFISTPRGKTNWFSGLFDRGSSDEFPEWCSIHATWEDNPRMTEDDIREAKATMSENLFKQEYEASFQSYEGQIWNLNEETCVVDRHEFMDGNNRHKLDVVAGLDLGFRDYTAMVVIGYCFDDEKFYILDEYFENDKTTSGYAAKIKELTEKWDIDFTYIDSSAQQTKFDLARDYDIATINAKKSVNDSIGAVASLVDNDRVIVPRHCTEVLRAFDAYRWDPNPNLIKEKPVHDIASHMADALRYALYNYADVGLG